ncbi:hypothetical protein FKM82_024569 [Ascaphus truei]
MPDKSEALRSGFRSLPSLGRTLLIGSPCAPSLWWNPEVGSFLLQRDVAWLSDHSRHRWVGFRLSRRSAPLAKNPGLAPNYYTCHATFS